MKSYYVYIMSNKANGTLYVGSTTDLLRRVEEHKAGDSAFTGAHGLSMLVWYEEHADISTAAERERLIKKWRCNSKLNLIESLNPGWRDLADDLA
ncbi:GIY-YIG nuclease family protein [Deltaproteobacteria bacterium OttesenSCG-928-M10]|nr:GIY-YIG nuclease family protein [Deltaproteobacteria bacterium OttesenSCG-928-M10]